MEPPVRFPTPVSEEFLEALVSSVEFGVTGCKPKPRAKSAQERTQLLLSQHQRKRRATLTWKPNHVPFGAAAGSRSVVEWLAHCVALPVAGKQQALPSSHGKSAQE